MKDLINAIKNYPLITYCLLIGSVCLTIIIHNPNNPYIVAPALMVLNPILVIPYIIIVSII